VGGLQEKARYQSRMIKVDSLEVFAKNGGSGAQAQQDLIYSEQNPVHRSSAE
jgi:hypothetical protein